MYVMHINGQLQVVQQRHVIWMQIRFKDGFNFVYLGRPLLAGVQFDGNRVVVSVRKSQSRVCTKSVG